jgi:hypothetical protein
MSTGQAVGQICKVEKLSAVARAFFTLAIPTPPSELNEHNLRRNPLQDNARPPSGARSFLS